MSSLLEQTQPDAATLAKEVARRRTFAIISHPDAGKTTLTEKLLLYAGAVTLAGAVRARKNQRHATSDWMTMEQKRGISITATALEMDYQGYRINLLDTPGHQDFSEDTYRTLMAVDSAVMVLDSAKGIEPQTLKLFQVCRVRNIPIITFINKMDRAGRHPLELLDEIERTLSIVPIPMNWPIASGDSFQGVYDLEGKRVLRFERTAHGERRAPVTEAALDDPGLGDLLGSQAATDLREELALLDGTGGGFDRHAFLGGRQTPVFFGSGINNFGVEPFLQGLVTHCPPPGPRESEGRVVEPVAAGFSGLVFKVQANMDPKHRDRMAFMRVVSGRFEKDMTVAHPRLGKSIRLARAFRLFGRDREPVDEAYAGDVIGLISPGLFAIGDTLSLGQVTRFPDLPRFAPEHFGILTNTDITRYKQFHDGLQQLEEEGAMQVLYGVDSVRREPILAVGGQLQFEVIMGRLEEEYGVRASLERLPYTRARWITEMPQGAERLTLTSRGGTMRCKDRQERSLLLFASEWDLEYCRRENPGLELTDVVQG